MKLRSLVGCVLALFAAGSARADWTATGQFNYTDRLYDLAGFTTTTVRPVREADVQIYDTTTLAVLASGATNSAGNFSITVPDAATRDVGVRVLSSNVQVASLNFSVVDDVNSDAIYSYHDSTTDRTGHLPADNVDFGTMTMPASIGAVASTDWSSQVFNIYDMGLLVADWIANADGARPAIFYTMGWNPTQGRPGSFYSGGTNRLSLSDDDAYDDPNILHEIGHYIEDEFGLSRNTGGSHSIGDDDQDPRLAYSEGFATFVSAATLNLGGRDRPDIYQDRDSFGASPGVGFSYSFEAGTVGGSTNEQTSTAALYDLIDTAATLDGSPGTDDDPLASLQANVWSVVEQMRVLNLAATSLEDFWDIWFSLGLGNAAGMATVFASHNCDFAPDAQEPNNTPATATTLTPGASPVYQRNSFFRGGAVSAGDEDWFKFTATAGTYYSIEVNGAADSLFGRPDPEMWLFDPTLSTVLAYNDDPNDLTLNTQASSTAQDMSESVPVILWQAPANGVYHVYLRHTAQERALLGRYGTYHIRVRSLAVPTPTVTTVAEQRMLQGQSYQVLVLGTNFSRGATVTTNDAGVAVSEVKWLAPSALVATLTPSGAVADGTYSLSVTNPGGVAGTLASAFEVNSAAAPPLRITEAELNNDAVELKNLGTVAATLTGWTLRTSQPSAYTYTFPTFTLAAGATVIVRDTAGTNTATDLFGSVFPWNNSQLGDLTLADDGGRNVDFLRWVTSPTSTHTAPLGTGGGWLPPQFQAPAVGFTVARAEATAAYRTPFGLSKANATMPAGAGSRANNVDEWEDNDLAARAPIFGPVASLTDLRISARASGTDSDWFGFLVEPGENVVFDALFTHASGNLDLQLYAPGETTTPLLSSTTTANNEQIALSAAQSTASGGGVYRVRVFGVSGAVNTYSLNVAPGQAAPALTLPGGAVAYIENDPATVLDAAATVTDSDSANFDTGSFTVDFTAGGAAEDRLAIRNEGTGAGQIGVSGANVSFSGATIGNFAGGTGTTPLAVAFNSIATPAAVQALARNLTYQNVSDTPSIAARTVRFVVTDGDGGTSPAATKTVNVAAVNDRPVVTTTSGNLAYAENQAATAIDSGLTLADLDGASLAGGSVAITTNFSSVQDVLAFTNQGGISGIYSAATGVLTLTGPASLAAYQTALRTVSYFNSSENPSTAPRTITFTVNDGQAANNLGSNTRGIAVTVVNDAPVLTATAGSLAYTEDQAATVIDGALTVADVDSTSLTGATVSISGNFANGQDVLGFTSPGGISGSYNAGSGVLTFSGTATLATYQTALRSVTYSNSSQNPSTAARTVTFTGNDGAAANNLGSTTRTITVTAVNDAPIVGTTGANLAYAENETAVAIDVALTVNDADTANLTGATVAVTGNFASTEDVLAFTNQGGISGIYSAATGVLTLTGPASLASYQTALRSVTYFNSSENPSIALRTITFAVNDGQAANNLGSNSRGIAVNAVNDAPALTATAGSLAYTEDQTATAIDPALTVADADSTNLIGATVSISANFSSGQDVLGFTDQGGITGSYNAGAGVLTLTGSAMLANYQTALRSVTYFNSNNSPSTATRTINFTADDGAASNNLGSASRAVTFTAVNDAPLVATTAGSLAYTENQAATAIDSALSLTDADSANLAGAAVAITGNFATGEDELAFANQGGITGSFDAGTGVLTLSGSATVAAYQGAFRSVTYFNSNENPSGVARTITFTADDGEAANNLGSAIRAVAITAVNDAPTSSAPALVSGTEDNALNFTSGDSLTVSDVDGENLTVTLTATQGTMTLGTQTGVSFTAGTGTADATMTFSGAQAALNTALASLTFAPTPDYHGSATLSFTTVDGAATPVVKSIALTMTAVADTVADTVATSEDLAVTFNVLTGTGGASADNFENTPTVTAVTQGTKGGVTFTSSGALTYTPAADTNGPDSFAYTVTSGGVTETGSVSVNVASINDPPSFVKGGDITLLQYAGAQTVTGWATAISAGGADETGQTLTFEVTTNSDALFAVLPAISAAGTLTFTPNPAANGTATVTVMLSDSGDGTNASAPQTFTISSTAVNEPPTFVLGGNQSAPQEAGAQIVAGFASAISPGPADESGQTLEFLMEVSQPDLFTGLPAISTAGNLTYTPDPAASGSAIVTVRLRDNGPSTAPDNNLSAPQTFQIAITTFVEELGTYNGLALPSTGAMPGADKVGVLKLTMARKGKVTGKLKLGAFSHAFTGTIDNAGVVTFGKTKAPTANLKRKAPLGALTLGSLRVDVGGGSDSLTAVVTDGAAPFATINADRALYTSKKNPAPPFMNVPLGLQGNYTALFSEPVATALPLPPAVPRGDGFAKVVIGKNGIAKLTGTLADGSKITSANALSKLNFWPLRAAMAKGRGALAGPVHFQTLGAPNPSDFDGPDLMWFQPANDKSDQFPAGWPAGLNTDLFGSRYVVPPKQPPASVLPGLTLTDADGNAKLTLTDGDLVLPFEKALNISEKNKVLVVTAAGDKLKLTITAASGLFKGSFVPPGGTKALKFQGALFPAQRFGAGFFLGPTESGAVLLVPAATPGVP